MPAERMVTTAMAAKLSRAEQAKQLAERKDKIVDEDTLGQFLEDQTKITYKQIRDEQKLDRGLVKSYLIETHLVGETNVDRWSRLLDRTRIKHGKGVTYSVAALADPNVVRLTIKEPKKDAIDLFANCKGGRYWSLFSVDDSASVLAGLERLILHDCSLDHLWLPQSFLLKMRSWGTLRLLRLYHNRNDLHPIDDDEDFDETESQTFAAQRRRLQRAMEVEEKMAYELKGATANDGLEALRARPNLESFINVSGLQIVRRRSEDEDDFSFSIDDIRHNGRFTTRGTSIDEHLKLLSSISRTYGDAIEQIEGQAIRMGSGTVTGSPFVFEYGREAEDLPDFIASVFSGEKPFRLWGMARRLSKDAYRVVGTDTHSGTQFHAEVFPTYLNFYLRGNGCGNTIPRFWTNLQRIFSGSTRLLDSRGDEMVLF